jgi:hypothetical protein
MNRVGSLLGTECWCWFFLGSLYCVDVSNVDDILEVNVTFIFQTLKMEAECISEMLASWLTSTQCRDHKIKSMSISQKGSCGGNALGLYLGGAWFESWLRHQRYWPGDSYLLGYNTVVNWCFGGVYHLYLQCQIVIHARKLHEALLPASCRILAWLTLWHWRRKWYVPLKC